MAKAHSVYCSCNTCWGFGGTPTPNTLVAQVTRVAEQDLTAAIAKLAAHFNR